ncbi:MAG: DMP19 family protein [Clostridiales bacterium]|jgi:hypothetical protein|nr:DMP19 family protein [Clostridiales bacterium]
MLKKLKEKIELKKAIRRIAIPHGRAFLPLDYLKSLDKDSRVQEIAYHISDYVLTKKDVENPILLNGYSQGMQMLWTTWHLQGEVNNGGFCQYFDNNTNLYSSKVLKEYYELTKDSFQLLRCDKIGNAFEEARLLFYSAETDCITQENLNNSWNRLDCVYFDNEEEFLRRRAEYVEMNLSEFTVN